MTKREIIEETAAFYNTNNRGNMLNTMDKCCYATERGTNCAVGRCMNDEGLEKYGDSDKAIGALIDLRVTDYVSIDYLLKPEYHGHAADFWRRLQIFHDVKANWNEEGLSKMGMINKEILIEAYP